ncbi:cell division protein ZapA [Propionivibrio sp.]|uniref:cell division protein ZapA n=1 Tax=Propionivibrio sp. TaxID=2212460 RepID=UPI00345BE320
MTNETNHLDITLLGKEYRVACPPDEHDALLSAVAYVDEKMRDIAEKPEAGLPSVSPSWRR